jgi:hypothetical protein
MKRSSVALFTGAVAALLFAGPSARADFVQWRYNWSPSTLKLGSDTHPLTSYAKFTNEPTDSNDNPLPSKLVSGDSDIQVTNIKLVSDAPRGAPDSFDASSPVTFKLTLTDVATAATMDFLFPIKFLGTVSGGTTPSAHLRVDPASLTTHFDDVQIGGSFYTINSVTYTPPGPPTSDPSDANSGSISATVTVRPVDVQKAPEPSTMVLSAVSLSFLGLASWRKRRQKALLAA